MPTRLKPTTAQELNWAGPKGTKYANTYFLEPKVLDRKWSMLTGGTTRTMMNEEFVAGLPRDTKMLEVGCNVGNQLALLRRMGFRSLYGIEICKVAVELANKRRPKLKIIQGTALDLPYQDETFDLVFTTWVLTHIAPGHLPLALDGIYRCSRRFIWGCEPYLDSPVPVERKPKRAYLWRGDYKRLFLERFPGLKVVKVRQYDWVNRRRPGPELWSEMYLLEKTG